MADKIYVCDSAGTISTGNDKLSPLNSTGFRHIKVGSTLYAVGVENVGFLYTSWIVRVYRVDFSGSAATYVLLDSDNWVETEPFQAEQAFLSAATDGTNIVFPVSWDTGSGNMGYKVYRFNGTTLSIEYTGAMRKGIAANSIGVGCDGTEFYIVEKVDAGLGPFAARGNPIIRKRNAGAWDLTIDPGGLNDVFGGDCREAVRVGTTLYFGGNLARDDIGAGYSCIIEVSSSAGHFYDSVNAVTAPDPFPGGNGETNGEALLVGYPSLAVGSVIYYVAESGYGSPANPESALMSFDTVGGTWARPYLFSVTGGIPDIKRPQQILVSGSDVYVFQFAGGSPTVVTIYKATTSNLTSWTVFGTKTEVGNNYDPLEAAVF